MTRLQIHVGASMHADMHGPPRTWRCGLAAASQDHRGPRRRAMGVRMTLDRRLVLWLSCPFVEV